MGEKLVNTLITIIGALIAVAIIAVLVSKRSATPQVIQAGGQAFASILNAAFAGGQTGIGVGPIKILPPNFISFQ